jgi:hypothetical protein
VVVVQNDLADALPVRLAVGRTVVAATLPPDSFSTFVVKSQAAASGRGRGRHTEGGRT